MNNIMNMNFFINSPLEQFEVTSLIGINFPIFGYINLSLTNFGLYTIISVFLVIGLHYFGNNNKNIIPSKWSIALESSYATMHGLVKAQIGPKNEQYLPFIYSLFFFLLFANLNGNIPYGFTITTSIIASIGFSVIIFLGVTILGLRLHKVHFFSFFIPSGTPLALVPLLVPIEIISYVARAFSLGVRIFSNMVGGHVLMKVFSSFVAPIVSSGIILAVVSIAPIILFTILVGLEIAVSFIQSFVFTILTASYLKDAIDLH